MPLSLDTQCEPKDGGKHAGKFYVRTATRNLKLVAADATVMAEWVDAINTTREALDDLSEGSLSFRPCSGREPVAPGGAGGIGAAPGLNMATDPCTVALPECVQVWDAAHDKGGTPQWLALNVTQQCGGVCGISRRGTPWTGYWR